MSLTICHTHDCPHCGHDQEKELFARALGEPGREHITCERCNQPYLLNWTLRLQTSVHTTKAFEAHPPRRTV